MFLSCENPFVHFSHAQSYFRTPSDMTDPPGNATTRPVALVTGCTDGSIGSALALSYLRRGYRVLATLRDPSKASCLAGLPNLHTIALDVTNSLSLTDTAHTIQSDFEGRLDVLVNNAGVGYTTPLLDATLDEARHVFEVNFWACVATVQAFAPFLLRVSGTVVNMSSVGSRLPTTWTGELTTTLPQAPQVGQEPGLRSERAYRSEQ